MNLNLLCKSFKNRNPLYMGYVSGLRGRGFLVALRSYFINIIACNNMSLYATDVDTSFTN